MKRKIALPIALVLVAAALFWAFKLRKGNDDLVLSGSIEARDVQVGSLVGGRVTAVHVDEGASVTAGQPIVTLEPDLLDAQVREQESRVEQARARLALVVAGARPEEIARARADYENAEKERRRLELLMKEGIIARQTYDDAATAARTKQEMLRELQRGNRPQEIEAAQGAVAEAERHLAYLRRQREETVVKAPAAGVVQSFDLRPGDLVAPNAPVATLLEPDQLWVRVFVPEPKLGLVRVGQRADLTVDTFPKRTFPGKVVEISPRAQYTPRNIQTLDQRSDQVFGVKVNVEPAPELKPGMAALVRLQP
ncbi:MAG TPA: HlyD family efflux transporter periplasmic adaptor subunit [Vicinamibacteria bacterium]